MTNLVLGGSVKLDNNIEEVSMYKYLGHELQIGKDNPTHEL